MNTAVRAANNRAVYSVPEVAALLDLSPCSVYELLRDGSIPARQLGRRWIISRERFNAWLVNLPDELEEQP